MAIQKLNQLQITGSLTAGYNDSVGTDASEVAPSIGAAMKISPSLLVDMNNIRALVKDIKGGSNWYDAAPNDVDLAQLTTHINASAGHGVNGLVLKSGIISDTDSTDDIGASGTAFRKLYVDDIDLNGQGDISIGGTGRIDLDANDNTSIRASADDVITIEVGGADKLDIIATAIHPESDALMDLGTSAIGFNDLHLGSGGIINLDGGDVTLTHAAGKVTLGGDGAVEFDFGNHEMTNVDIDSGAIDGVTIGSNSAATALVVNGGVNIDDGGDGAIDGCVIGANTAAAGTFTAVVGTTGVYSGILKTDDATDATSKTDGSLQTDGGLSVAKAIYNGTAATLAADSGVVTIGSSTAAVFSAAGKLAINSTVEATSTTDGSLQTDGGLSVAKDVVAGNDLKLKSDSAELVFGAGDDVKLVHTNDVGLHLNAAMRLGFRDQGDEYIYSVSDGVLGLVGGSEIDLTATDIDINGAVDISSTLAVGGNTTISGNLTVLGAAVELSSSNTVIKDALIVLNSSSYGDGTPIAQDAGIIFAQPDMSRVLFTDITDSSVMKFAKTYSSGTATAIVPSGLADAAMKKLYFHDVGGEHISSDGSDMTIAAGGSIIVGAHLKPASDAGADLGTSGVGFNDLHLGSGGIINLDGGDVTLTHAAGKVTLGGDGAVEFDFGNHEMTNVDIDSGAIDGTVIGAQAVANGSFLAVVGTTGIYSGILKTDDATDASSTTDGSLQTDGGLSVVKDAVLGNDLKLKSDSAELVFGAGDDVKLIHTNDVGLHLNAAMRLGFRDQGDEYIYSVSDGVLGLKAGSEIDLTATLIDINGAANIDGQVDFGGNLDATGGVDIDADNVKLTIGAGADLEMIHNGTDSFITNLNGHLTIGASATAKNLLLSGSSVNFTDGNAGGSTWSATGLSVSSSPLDWTNVEAAFGTELSLMAMLYDLKQPIKAVMEVTASSIVAGNSVDLRGVGADFSKAAFNDAGIQVFKNGLMMLSGTHAQVSAGTAQYALSGTDAPYRLRFADQLLQGDVLVALIK